MDCKYSSGRILHVVPFNHIFDCLSSEKSFYFDEGSNCYFQCTSEIDFTKIVVTDLVGKSTLSFLIPGVSKIHTLRINKIFTFAILQRSGNYIELVSIIPDQISPLLCYESDKDTYIRSFSFTQDDFFVVISNNSIKTFKINTSPFKISQNSIINCISTWNTNFHSFITNESTNTTKFHIIAHGNCSRHLLNSTVFLKNSTPSLSTLINTPNISSQSLIDNISRENSNAQNPKNNTSDNPAFEIGIILFHNRSYKTATLNFKNKMRFGILNLYNVQIISIYKSVYLAIIDQNPTEIYLYKVKNKLDLNVFHIFSLNCSSISSSLNDLNIGVVDNVITIHDRAEKSTHLFDISVTGQKNGGKILECPQLVDRSKFLTTFTSVSNNFEYIDIYDRNFVFHKPDLVFDTLNGIVYQIHLDLDYISHIFSASYMDLVTFYIHRIDAKSILVRVISGFIFSKYPDFDIMGLFDFVIKCHSKTKIDDSRIRPGSTIAYDVEQQDIHVNIFFPLINSTVSMNTENHRSHLYYCYNVIFLFIAILRKYKHPIQHNIIETLSDVMVKLGMIDQLNDLLNSGIFTPSYELCRYFVSLCTVYPSLSSNVIDMCCLVDSLDGIFQIIAQNSSPSVINKFLKTLNSLELCDENQKRVNIFKELKIYDTFPMEITKKSAQMVEIETISNLLKTLSIKKTIEKLNVK